MTTGYPALSEKEKETLRLLLGGHDAKSIARHLGLSVHTINERLRDCRRKLGTSSSREAARRLADSEGGDPQNIADKEFGEARPGETGETGQVAAGKRARRAFAGVLVMMTLFAAGLILTSHLAEPVDQVAPIEIPASDAAVVAAARDWLALVDAGDWQASFGAAGKAFRDVNTVQSWTKVAKQVRDPQGALVSRELRTIRYLNAPPHGYQEVAFATRYANSKGEVIETVTLEHEAGAWKVVGIMVD